MGAVWACMRRLLVVVAAWFPHGACRQDGASIVPRRRARRLDRGQAGGTAQPGRRRCQYNASVVHLFVRAAMPPDPSVLLLYTLYLVAIVAEAMTAALAAGRRDMDWVGVCVIACVTALGGGSLRDVLLGHYPLSWVAHPEYLWMTAGAALLTALGARALRRLRSLFLLLDAIGLVAFTIIGCQVAQQMEMPLTIVLVSGMITGCAGGVLRDVLCNDIPLLFRSELYASVSAVTGGLYLAMYGQGVSASVSVPVALAVGLAFRLLALRFNWQMPKFVYRGDWH
ncbi:membrane protein [Bordetella pertussis]|nr:membrane protein [Bordetella pertussis]